MGTARTIRAYALAAGAAMAAFTFSAQAAVITWDFEATVFAATNSPFASGETITGSFSYDDSVDANAGATAQSATYSGAIRSFTIDGLATLQYDADGVTVNTILINDGFGTGPYLDRFNAVLHDTVTPQNRFELNMQRAVALSNPTCIGSVALPSSPFDVDCFNNARIFYDYLGSAGELRNIKANLTDADLKVPEPASVALLGLGLGMAGLAVARRRKQ